MAKVSKLKNIPQIRFKGFSDEWKDCELHQIIELHSGKDYKHLKKGSVPVYGTGGYMLSVNEALSYDKNAVGIGRKGTIDKPYILKAPFWTVDTLFYAIPRDDVNLDFVYTIFQNVDWKSKDESTGVPSLSKVAIKGVSIFRPKGTEQTKVGDQFKAIDRLIRSKQQKHDKLKNIKKALLQKMFPQENELTPQVRFRDFTDEWNDSELGLIYNFQYGEFNTNPDNGGEFPIYGANGKIGGYTRYNADSSVVIGHMGEYAGSVIWVKGKHFVTYNGTITTPKGSDFVPVYGYYMLIHMNIPKICNGSGQPFLAYDKLNKLRCRLPIQACEQAKIGELLQKLDKLIELQEKELTKLKNIKKALLQKMFV